MKDKVVIVTGGGRDIGKACALDLARCGATVILTYFASSKGADETVNEIQQLGATAVAIQADLTRLSDLNNLVATVIEKFAKIDCLVHVSGGLIGRVKIAEMTDEHWDKVLDVNLRSLFWITRACIPHMVEGSSIITFSSQAARDGGGPGAVAYAASKGAILSFTRGLAKELGPKIRVNSLTPGMIATGFHDKFTTANVRENVANACALKREGTADEVAKLVTFLASDDASYITGNCIDINGGLAFS